jgi:hypothetical protein
VSAYLMLPFEERGTVGRRMYQMVESAGPDLLVKLRLKKTQPEIRVNSPDRPGANARSLARLH